MKLMLLGRLFFSISLILCLFTGADLAQAQNPTIGLLEHNSQAHEGYVLFSPIRNKSVYLIDRCGYIVNQWITDDFPNRMSYLKSNGNLVRTTLKNRLEEWTWDGEKLWSMDFDSLGYKLHHDLALLPNGNTLVMAIELVSSSQQDSLGRLAQYIDGDMESEVILEVAIDGNQQPELVWKWRLIEHVVQDVDSNKVNYSEIDEARRKLDINYIYQDDIKDWAHFNSIAYNEEEDEIMVSSRHTSELYIVDHSISSDETSTEEGDFLWRWGNPIVYKSGTLADRKLYGQHDGNWMKHSDNTQVSVFNNGDERLGEFSSLHTLQLEKEPSGEYKLSQDGKYAPSRFEWTYGNQTTENVIYSFIEGGLEFISETDFLVSESSSGRMIQMDRQGEVSWVYRNPVNISVLQQNEDISFGPDYFKMVFYSKDYLDFQPETQAKHIIENENQLSVQCDSILSPTLQLNSQDRQRKAFLTFPSILHMDNSSSFKVFDMQGKLVFESKKASILDLSHLPRGLYLVQSQEIE